MKKKKILLIGPFPPPSGGVSVHLQRLLERAKGNPEISLSVFDYNKKKIFHSTGKTSTIFGALICFFSADILHIHISHPVKVFLAKLGKLAGKKVIYTQHNPREIEWESTRKIIQLADRVVFVFNPISFPENGILIPAFIPPASKKELPQSVLEIFGKYAETFVTVGSSSGKLMDEVGDLYGFDIILDAIPTAVVENAAFIFVDVKGKMKNIYSEKIRKIEIETGKKIIFIEQEVDFPELLKRSTAFIRATRSDGDSLSIREALSLGIPVIASDCVIRPTGCRLFKTADVKDLSTQIGQLKNTSRNATLQPDFTDQLFELYRKL